MLVSSTTLILRTNPSGLICGTDPGLAVTPEYASLCKIYSTTGGVSGDLIKDSEAEMRLVMARQ